MLRTHYKPRTHHRDGYHRSANVATLISANGRDLYDPHTAATVVPDVHVSNVSVTVDRYKLMADPTTRAALRAFDSRKRAARKAA